MDEPLAPFPDWKDESIDIDNLWPLEAEAWEARCRRAVATLEKIASGDIDEIDTPLGPLHHAGIALQWKIDATICGDALTAIGPLPPPSLPYVPNAWKPMEEHIPAVPDLTPEQAARMVDALSKDLGL